MIEAPHGNRMRRLVMPGAGLEPAWPCGQGILRPTAWSDYQQLSGTTNKHRNDFPALAAAHDSACFTVLTCRYGKRYGKVSRACQLPSGLDRNAASGSVAAPRRCHPSWLAPLRPRLPTSTAAPVAALMVYSLSSDG